MSRPGRKRKQGFREKNGRIQREREERLHRPDRELRPEEIVELRRLAARQQPHRMIVGDAAVHFPECETPLGCLFVVGAVPIAEWSAAQRFSGIVRRYREVLDCPRIAPSIAGFGQPASGGAVEIEDATERRRAYAAAHKAVRLAGETVASGHQLRPSWDLLVDMCADGKECPPGGFRTLIVGLHALHAHFREVDNGRRLEKIMEPC